MVPEKQRWLPILLLCEGCCNERVPAEGWLKEQQSTVSQFWRLEVKNIKVISGVDSF